MTSKKEIVLLFWYFNSVYVNYGHGISQCFQDAGGFRSSTTFGFLGCFAADCFKGEYNIKRNGMTIDNCTKTCSMEDYNNAALTEGRICYCGYLDCDMLARSCDELCGIACDGAPMTFCGGVKQFQVYNVSNGERKVTPAPGFNMKLLIPVALIPTFICSTVFMCKCRQKRRIPSATDVSAEIFSPSISTANRAASENVYNQCDRYDQMQRINLMANTSHVTLALSQNDQYDVTANLGRIPSQLKDQITLKETQASYDRLSFKPATNSDYLHGNSAIQEAQDFRERGCHSDIWDGNVCNGKSLPRSDQPRSNLAGAYKPRVKYDHDDTVVAQCCSKTSVHTLHVDVMPPIMGSRNTDYYNESKREKVWNNHYDPQQACHAGRSVGATNFIKPSTVLSEMYDNPSLLGDTFTNKREHGEGDGEVKGLKFCIESNEVQYHPPPVPAEYHSIPTSQLMESEGNSEPVHLYNMIEPENTDGKCYVFYHTVHPDNMETGT